MRPLLAPWREKRSYPTSKRKLRWLMNGLGYATRAYHPREFAAVQREPRLDNREFHMGHIFLICVEKNSELAEGDPARKYKGRVVFGGGRVIDQIFDAAMFQDLGSSPATMEAAKIANFFGCVPGHESRSPTQIRPNFKLT